MSATNSGKPSLGTSPDIQGIERVAEEAALMVEQLESAIPTVQASRAIIRALNSLFSGHTIVVHLPILRALVEEEP